MVFERIIQLPLLIAAGFSLRLPTSINKNRKLKLATTFKDKDFFKKALFI